MALIEELEVEQGEDTQAARAEAGGQQRAAEAHGAGSDSDSDDDEPPDLSTSAEQLAALNIKATRGTAAKGSSSGSSSGGSGSGSGTRVAPSKPKTGMMRGFFDAKPKAKPARRAASKEGPTEVRAAPGASADSLRSGKQVPDFMKLPEGEKERQAKAFKKQLTEALKPTPDMMRGITADEDLLAGFEDPEVMKAVDEIAKDPTAMRKHQNNPKVIDFYKRMSGMMAGQLENMGSAQDEVFKKKS